MAILSVALEGHLTDPAVAVLDAVRRPEIARAISDRTGLDFQTTFDTLFKCEDIIHGEPTNKAEAVRLTSELRDIETKLGLPRAGR